MVIYTATTKTVTNTKQQHTWTQNKQNRKGKHRSCIDITDIIKKIEPLHDTVMNIVYTRIRN